MLSVHCHLSRITLSAVLLASTSVLAAGAQIPEGLTFHVSFDKLHANADFSKGDGASKLTASLELRSTEGIKGSGLLQQPGERCTYDIEGNLDTSQGTYSVWVKPLNWEGHSQKFRHFLTVVAGPAYRMLAYLYPIGDEAVMNYLQLNSGTPQEAIFRAGTPVDILKRGEWTHLVTTWGDGELRVYANGKRVGEGLTAGELPKLTEGTFTVCPVEYWKHEKWSDPQERTLCDEVRLFSRPLTDDEVLDLYAAEAPEGLVSLEPTLTVELEPDYFARTITVTARAVHLDEPWRQLLQAGADFHLALTDPQGATVLDRSGALPQDPIRVELPAWRDGDYLAQASLSAEGERLEAQGTLTKPPTPWLPQQEDWRADRVLPPWSALSREGNTVGYWNGKVSLPGALPAQIVSSGEPLLAAPIRLVGEEAATWQAPRVVEDEPYRISLEGQGALGEFAASYKTLMEFDGLVRADITSPHRQEGPM